jgi:hypothetical protein
MKLSELENKIKEIKLEAKGDPEVCFDTEAAIYNVHIVPIDSAEYVPAEWAPGCGEGLIVLHTKEETSRRHLRDGDTV